MDYRKAAEARKSIRAFTDKPVSGELKAAVTKCFASFAKINIFEL